MFVFVYSKKHGEPLCKGIPRPRIQFFAFYPLYIGISCQAPSLHVEYGHTKTLQTDIPIWTPFWLVSPV